MQQLGFKFMEREELLDQLQDKLGDANAAVQELYSWYLSVASQLHANDADRGRELIQRVQEAVK